MTKPAPPPPALDERRLRYAELSSHASAYQPHELIAMLRDGRAVVRGNASLAWRPAAADGIGRLGIKARALVPAVTQALDGTQDVRAAAKKGDARPRRA